MRVDSCCLLLFCSRSQPWGSALSFSVYGTCLQRYWQIRLFTLQKVNSDKKHCFKNQPVFHSMVYNSEKTLQRNLSSDQMLRISISSLTTIGSYLSNTWPKPQWHGDPSVSLWEPGGLAKHLGLFRSNVGCREAGELLLWVSAPSFSFRQFPGGHMHMKFGALQGRFHFQWLERVFWVKNTL